MVDSNRLLYLMFSEMLAKKMLSLLVCLVGTIELSIKREFSTSPKINYILTKTLICCSIYNNIKYYYNHINSTKGDNEVKLFHHALQKNNPYFILLFYEVCCGEMC